MEDRKLAAGTTSDKVGSTQAMIWRGLHDINYHLVSTEHIV
jgi:hypothetical protein